MNNNKMKFWCGSHEVFSNLCTTLELLGYNPGCNIAYRLEDKQGRAIQLQEGVFSSACDERDSYWYNDLHDYEEIDIGWMVNMQRQTITIGDKTYYEDELAEALSKIKPVGSN